MAAFAFLVSTILVSFSTQHAPTTRERRPDLFGAQGAYVVAKYWGKKKNDTGTEKTRQVTTLSRAQIPPVLTWLVQELSQTRQRRKLAVPCSQDTLDRREAWLKLVLERFQDSLGHTPLRGNRERMYEPGGPGPWGFEHRRQIGSKCDSKTAFQSGYARH